MLRVDHHSVSSFTHFRMSPDYFYFITKAVIMPDEYRLLTSLQSIPNLNEIEQNV